MGSSRRKKRLDPYEYASFLMRYRPRSVFEMRKRLAERYGEDVAESVVKTLVEKKILDDRRFASMFARSELARLHGPRVIRSRLKSLGVDEDIVEEAIERAIEEFDVEKALRELLKKFKDVRKVREYLYRRGFDSSTLENLEVDE